MARKSNHELLAGLERARNTATMDWLNKVLDKEFQRGVERGRFEQRMDDAQMRARGAGAEPVEVMGER